MLNDSDNLAGKVHERAIKWLNYDVEYSLIKELIPLLLFL